MRLRITFSKSSALRYTGHLDLQKIWERTARRAGLLLAYSKGFHPLPKIQLAAALPLGFSSRAELVDIWLESAGFDPQMAILLQNAASPGLGILKIEEVDIHAPPLQTQVVSSEYEVTLLEPGTGSGLTRSLSAVMEAASLPRQRRGKDYNLRPLIEELAIKPDPSGGYDEKIKVFMRLASRAGATGRPEEVLEVLGISPEGTRIERVHLILDSGLKSGLESPN